MSIRVETNRAYEQQLAAATSLTAIIKVVKNLESGGNSAALDRARKLLKSKNYEHLCPDTKVIEASKLLPVLKQLKRDLEQTTLAKETEKVEEDIRKRVELGANPSNILLFYMKEFPMCSLCWTRGGRTFRHLL